MIFAVMDEKVRVFPETKKKTTEKKGKEKKKENETRSLFKTNQPFLYIYMMLFLPFNNESLSLLCRKTLIQVQIFVANL